MNSIKEKSHITENFRAGTIISDVINISSIFGPTDFQGQLVCIAEDREVSGMNLRQLKVSMQSGEKCT